MSLCFPAQGFIIESDYEGDDGHPRIGLIQPGTAANDVLVQGDIIMSINGHAVASHADAAKAIKAVKVGDVVIKVLAKKPRVTAPAIAAKELALEADAEQVAATKMQATIRGQQSRKSVDGKSVEVQSEEDKYPLTKDFFNNIKTGFQEASIKVQEAASRARVPDASPTSPTSPTDDEREAATKMQATIRGQQSRKAVANGDTPKDAPPALTTKPSFGEQRERPSFTFCTALKVRLLRAPGRRKLQGHDAEDRQRHHRALRSMHEPTQDTQSQCIRAAAAAAGQGVTLYHIIMPMIPTPPLPSPPVPVPAHMA